MRGRYIYIIVAGICAASSVGLSGCDRIYRMLDKEGAEEKELVGEVVPFEKNPTVEEIQALLSVYGYNPGNVDGVLGLQTRNALERFQKDQGLEQSRFADAATWEKLSIPVTQGLVVNGKIAGALVQKALAAAGYSPGSPDGVLGKRTTRAVILFQKQQGLKPDGKIGYKTLMALSAFLPQPSSQPETPARATY